MEKQEMMNVLQASLLLMDMPEEEVKTLVGEGDLAKAKYVYGFLRTYPC